MVNIIKWKLAVLYWRIEKVSYLNYVVRLFVYDIQDAINGNIISYNVGHVEYGDTL